MFKNLPYILTLFICLISSKIATAQDSVWVFYNKTWITIPAESEKRKYYREGVIYNEKRMVFHGKVTDYYASGEKQMQGNYDMGSKEGAIYFLL